MFKVDVMVYTLNLYRVVIIYAPSPMFLSHGIITYPSYKELLTLCFIGICD